MSLADKYMREACDMCENHAKNFSCEDKHTCPVYKLYCIASGKEKVIVKSGSWDTPPAPRPEMI